MVDIKGKRYYLVYCPITQEYWLMDDKKTPCITSKPYIYRPLQCQHDNYICHTISKNGCASVLKSILWADGKISKAEKVSNAFIWASYRDYPYYQGDIDAYGGTRFIALQPEKDRIIRWANWLNTNRYAR